MLYVYGDLTFIAPACALSPVDRKRKTRTKQVLYYKWYKTTHATTAGERITIHNLTRLTHIYTHGS